MTPTKTLDGRPKQPPGDLTRTPEQATWGREAELKKPHFWGAGPASSPSPALTTPDSALCGTHRQPNAERNPIFLARGPGKGPCRLDSRVQGGGEFWVLVPFFLAGLPQSQSCRDSRGSQHSKRNSSDCREEPGEGPQWSRQHKGCLLLFLSSVTTIWPQLCRTAQ